MNKEENKTMIYVVYYQSDSHEFEMIVKADSPDEAKSITDLKLSWDYPGIMHHNKELQVKRVESIRTPQVINYRERW